jgi:hypothetical protein
MKWIILLMIMAAVVPFSGWLRRNPVQAPIVWTLMGFLPFVLSTWHLYMAPISWPDWPGYVKGMEFSILDAVALALYISVPGVQRPLPFRISMGLYFIAVIVSVFQAKVPVAALFYPWQLARMFLVYAAVSRGCADPRTPGALLKGLAAGLFLEVGVAIWQRVELGMIQTPGTLDHQNLLGFISHMLVFPFFALFVAGNNGRLPAIVVLAGIILEVLTTSRATVGLALFGYASVFALSAFQRWTSRKGVILFTGIVAIAAFTPLALMSFDRRFAAEETSESYDERAAFKVAAAKIVSDHPLGIGANNYVLTVNLDGYNDFAGVIKAESSRGTNVHNVYWLVAAETGYPGIITFVLFLIRPLSVALICGWRNRYDKRGELLLGIGIALLTVYVHSFFEWIFVAFQSEYIFSMQLGLVAGLAQQLGYWRRSQVQVQPDMVPLAIGRGLPGSASQ